MRVGIGQDSHRLKLKIKNDKTRKNLILGGVEISREYYLEANSDGDVVLHALCNALSSAVGGNSLGTWADRMCLKEGITDSKEFVRVIHEKVRKNGFRVHNASFSVETEQPKISLKTIHKMKKRIAGLLKIPLSCVGITFTSGEEFTAFGKGKGIQVFCIVSLENK